MSHETAAVQLSDSSPRLLPQLELGCWMLEFPLMGEGELSLQLNRSRPAGNSRVPTKESIAIREPRLSEKPTAREPARGRLHSYPPMRSTAAPEPRRFQFRR